MLLIRFKWGVSAPSLQAWPTLEGLTVLWHVYPVLGTLSSVLEMKATLPCSWADLPKLQTSSVLNVASNYFQTCSVITGREEFLRRTLRFFLSSFWSPSFLVLLDSQEPPHIFGAIILHASPSPLHGHLFCHLSPSHALWGQKYKLFSTLYHTIKCSLTLTFTHQLFVM